MDTNTVFKTHKCFQYRLERLYFKLLVGIRQRRANLVGPFYFSITLRIASVLFGNLVELVIVVFGVLAASTMFERFFLCFDLVQVLLSFSGGQSTLLNTRTDESMKSL
mmetsp:Transcript_11696/g.22402  ORF Transcript_11696/g.22402 Transcript_11696/m.22402 type:complete len:108 (-) Transcript_11696:2412-2735(-)